MEIRTVHPADALAAPVFAGLAHEYEVRYGENDELATTTADEFVPPQGLFLVAVDHEGAVVAGGGFRRHDDRTCEVKRMWVHPDRRRRGLASLVLAALEDGARAAGYRRLVLETGPAQPEAEAMYVARGYRRIPVFGRYPTARAFEIDLHPTVWRGGPPAPPGPHHVTWPAPRHFVGRTPG